ncbi:ribosome assembly RNA-binding protein YhbY [Lysobacter sp. GX 14042]|uniref:ribosome assembly RNA-binding protein YhbY n=1 Tax=Lysobacter sp. GX 14042 TaxID=2907155 RepID=UPI001EFF901D|nr:ribosome assembly RNA-binding protein YhbY [Lysobacter sp. GX 14042]MCE7032575.1 ribosome assembly RNA-binding protein YhbY [Lysobacter sp. GX 14042]
MSTPLSSAQTRFLRGMAHGLRAMIQVGGKGVTENLVAELDLALEHHELVKVRVAGAEREERDAMIARLAEQTGAALVQRIGHTAVFYRQSREHREIVLPR